MMLHYNSLEYQMYHRGPQEITGTEEVKAKQRQDVMHLLIWSIGQYINEGEQENAFAAFRENLGKHILELRVPEGLVMQVAHQRCGQWETYGRFVDSQDDNPPTIEDRQTVFFGSGWSTNPYIAERLIDTGAELIAVHADGSGRLINPIEDIVHWGLAQQPTSSEV